MNPPTGPGPTDRYRRLERIATGGMGEVWRAEDTVLHREVALKLLKPEFAEDPDFRERFATEARNAAGLMDGGIAAVFDYGEVQDGDRTRPFLVMELVEGQPLSALLRGGEPMPPETAADLVGQAAQALGAAHGAGLVHRDVKPANLLVTAEGRVKVTDFGIARAADAVPLTSTGQIVGTPQYLSPEQANGQQATTASDVYSLGVVLFECLAGERPFRGDTPVSTALAHLTQPVPDLPAGVPDELAAVTRTALAKDPADRYPDGTAMAAALREPTPTRVLTVPPVSGPAAATALLATRRRVPGWWPVAVAGTLGVILVAALVLANGSGTDNTPRDGTASSPATVSPSPTPSPTRTTAQATQATQTTTHHRHRPGPGPAHHKPKAKKPHGGHGHGHGPGKHHGKAHR